jgi:hypothetical protein
LRRFPDLINVVSELGGGNATLSLLRRKCWRPIRNAPTNIVGDAKLIRYPNELLTGKAQSIRISDLLQQEGY